MTKDEYGRQYAEALKTNNENLIKTIEMDVLLEIMALLQKQNELLHEDEDDFLED